MASRFRWRVPSLRPQWWHVSCLRLEPKNLEHNGQSPMRGTVFEVLFVHRASIYLMASEGAVADSGQRGPDQQQPTGSQRKFGAARVRPRVEVSRKPLAPQEPPIPSSPEEESFESAPIGSSVFGQPREFAGGRVRVHGCSPGCLVASIGASILLSWLLTALVN